MDPFHVHLLSWATLESRPAFLNFLNILKLQELKFYYKYKNNKLQHYLQMLPFHPNTKTHDHDTRLKHHIHHPRGVGCG